MRKKAGFTLIEVIVSLVLVGMMAAVAGTGLVTGVRGYIFAKDNAVIAQKYQLALARMNRELMELADVSTAESSRVTYVRVVGGGNVTQTLYLDTATHKIMLASGADATGGDALLDNVNTLTFHYYKGTAAWVQGTDSSDTLSSVSVSLVLDRPGTGDTIPVEVGVTPRNNKNYGGAAPTTNPPAKVGYNCFVATAAYGRADHPQVFLLRQFRDRYLRGWEGGEILLKAYSAAGPTLAELIRERPWACTLTRAILVPFVGAAFLMLKTPLALPLMLLLSWLLARTGLRFLGGRRGRSSRPPLAGRRGSVLIGLILTMVIFASLGAAMLSLTSTSALNQVAGNGAMRAYYLAESGYRYAASQFLNAGTESQKDASLENLNTRTFSLSGNAGKFRLDIYPYFYKTTADPGGTTTLSTKVNGTIPSDLSLSTGFLKINGIVHQYSAANPSGSNITFTRSSGTWPAISTGSNVNPVSRPNASQTMNNSTRDYIDLETTTNSAAAFPIQNATFKIEGANTVYTYRRKNGNRLEGITTTDPSGTYNVPLTTASNVVLEKFVRMKATGIYADASFLETRREILYYVPIGWAEGGAPQGKVTVADTMDSMNNWFTGSDQGEVGTHAIATVGGNAAMTISGATTPSIFSGVGIWSLVNFNWSSAGANLAQTWQSAGNLLSYDLQVKAAATNQPYYFAGLLFRTFDPGDGDFYTYGLSFLRARQTRSRFGGNPRSSDPYIQNSDMPADIIPAALYGGTLETGSVYSCGFFGWWRCQDRYSQPAVLLWKRDSAGFEWLAYQTLTYVSSAQNYVINSSNRLVDWSNLQVRVIEAYPLSFNQGGATPLLYGETITGAASAATARVAGTPVLASGSWAGGSAAGILTLSNISGTFQNGENLLVGGTTRARVSGTLGTRTNFIRAYYGDVSAHGTANAIPTDDIRGGNPRLASGASNVNWPVDDITAWAAENDDMTLVQWDGVNTGITRLGTGTESNAVIRDDALTTPASGTFTRSEIALHSGGGTANNVDFDDFAIQLEGTAGSSTGFLPPIQE